MSMIKKKDLITQEEIDQCLKHISNNNDKTNQEQLLKLLQEMQITSDDPTYEDSIDGTRIRAACTIEISRKGGGAGEQGENVIRFNISKKSTLIMVKCQ